jgi:ectoine hydroxylase-related dioxygenase (phytanoyl-CoA dioxygenase family)
MTLQEAVRTVVLPGHVEEFRSKGFVQLAGLLSPATIERLRRAMTEALESFDTSPSSYDITAMADSLWDTQRRYDTGTSRQHDLTAFKKAIDAAGHPRLLDADRWVAKDGRFLVDTSVWRRVPLLAEFALHGPLGRIASVLLGAERIRYYDDQLFIKEPGTADRASFHQDLPYFNLGGEAGCVVWIPLDAVKRGGGSIGYIPGSHKWGMFNPTVFMSRAAFPGSQGRDLPDIESDPDAYGVVHVEVEPGDVIIHHFLTVHGSEGNLTSGNRRAFSLRYCDAAIPYLARAGAPTQPLHESGKRDGDPLDDSIHPVVWPTPRDAALGSSATIGVDHRAGTVSDATTALA